MSAAVALNRASRSLERKTGGGSGLSLDEAHSLRSALELVRGAVERWERT